MDSEQLAGLIAIIRKWLANRRKEQEKKPKKPDIPELFTHKPFRIKELWDYAWEHEAFDTAGVMRKSWLDSLAAELGPVIKDKAVPIEKKTYLSAVWTQADLLQTMWREYKEELKK